MSALAINGTKSSGQDVRSANVTAVLAIFNVRKNTIKSNIKRGMIFFFQLNYSISMQNVFYFFF